MNKKTNECKSIKNAVKRKIREIDNLSACNNKIFNNDSTDYQKKYDKIKTLRNYHKNYF